MSAIVTIKGVTLSASNRFPLRVTLSEAHAESNGSYKQSRYLWEILRLHAHSASDNMTLYPYTKTRKRCLRVFPLCPTQKRAVGVDFGGNVA